MLLLLLLSRTELSLDSLENRRRIFHIAFLANGRTLHHPVVEGLVSWNHDGLGKCIEVIGSFGDRPWKP